MVNMTYDELANLEHITFEEDSYYVYLTPDVSYYLLVEDVPEYVRFDNPDTLKMLKQSRYSEVLVKPLFDPSVGSVSLVDTSIN